MPEKILPVFQIRDFTQAALPEASFYLNRLESHISAHAFIQKPHKHDFYILLYITNGSGTHTIDFKTYPVQPGTVFFLSPGQVHSWALSADTAGFILFFTPGFLLAGKAAAGMYHFPFFNSLENRSCLLLPKPEDKNLETKLLEMETEYAAAFWKKEVMLQNLLENLLIYFARKLQEGQKQVAGKPGRLTLLQQLEDLINAHFKEHQPVSFYAGKLHITTKQLNEAVNQLLNKTTQEVIQERFMLEARRLLTHSGLTITQVAAELGFFDNSYFSRFFKKHCGQTPEQFRQSVK